jgi:hypothetical protein
MSLENRFIRAAIGEKTPDGYANENILHLYTYADKQNTYLNYLIFLISITHKYSI